MINQEEILVPQPRLGTTVYVTTLIIMMTVQWMTLDMYLPALPVLKTQFGASEALLNISLNSDLFACAIGTLIGGTISDKYGRNPIMIIGLILAGVPLLAAGFSQGVWFLTIMRGLSGLGGGFALTVAAAIVRDSFKGRTFQLVTTLTQAAAVIGPLFAPAIGAFLIEYLSWRWIFFLEAGAILLTLIPFFIAAETWPKEKRQVDNVLQATIQAFDIARDPKYLCFIGWAMILTIPLWAYIGVCSYVYYEYFGVSNLQYAILYAAGTLVSFSAPFLYMFLTKATDTKKTAVIAILMTGVAAILFGTIGHVSPVLFLVAMVPVYLVEGIVRTLGTVEVLNRYHEEAGSASAVNGFALLIISVPGTAIATIGWSSFITGIAVITGACAVCAALLWIHGRKFVE